MKHIISSGTSGRTKTRIGYKRTEAAQIDLRVQGQLAAWRAASSTCHVVVSYDAATQARHALLVADYIDAVGQDAARKLWRGIVSRATFRRARASRCVTATSHIGVRSHGLASRVARARSPRSLRRGRASRSPGGGGGSSSGSDQDAAASERYLRVTDGIDLFGREDAIDRDPTPDIRIARDDDDVRPAAALSVVADGLRYADARARRLITLSWSGSSVYMLADGWKILVSVRGVLVHAAVVDDTFGARHLAIHRAGARGVPIDDGVRFVGWIARLITTPTDERAPDLAVNAWGTAGRPPEVKR